MAHVTLTKVKNPALNCWLRAVSTDYSVPHNAQVFLGSGLHNDLVAVWVDEDGSGFGAIDGNPAGYVKFSRALAANPEAIDVSHPGVDEYEFEPGTFDPAAETIEFDVSSSFF